MGEHNPTAGAAGEAVLTDYANLKLALRGLPVFGGAGAGGLLAATGSLVASLREKNRLLADYLSPADRRLHSFLERMIGPFAEGPVPLLPADALVLDRAGLARVLSLPPDRDEYRSDILSSYRVKQGVLHNPRNDRRTTEGVFHVADCGFPVPADKRAVPPEVFAALYALAVDPPRELLELPFTASQEERAAGWVSLLLRPLVCPAVEGVTPARTMEVRFFAPGSMVANLDFVESIFGNAGDPYLPENDAALDPESWTGHSGCVILAPHLTRARKKDLGLPHVSAATERQRRDGMCWEDEAEPYNGGGAFKLTCRDRSGQVVTLIADNYFGYCKKEVKTQISFSANLLGFCEEEHAGGALAFPSYDLGEDFTFGRIDPDASQEFADTVRHLGDAIEVRAEGYAVDRRFRDICYVPKAVRFNLDEQRVSWAGDGGGETAIRLRPGCTYVLPSGYKVEMHKPAEGRRWRLIGTTAEGTFCHKPCTVSGGGKSEISKSISDAILHAPVFVADFEGDFAQVEAIISRDYSDRFRPGVKREAGPSRPLLSPKRSLGSVIKLLTPSADYTDEYNAWLRGLAFYIKDLVLLVKRYHKEDWGTGWRERFGVDVINGIYGNQLKYRASYIRAHYLRVGYMPDGSWRTFSLRKDFSPAVKVQMEDDITASIVVPSGALRHLDKSFSRPSAKIAANCENRLFQRPDDAIHRGADKTTERDFSGGDLFFSNYEPLGREQVAAMEADAIRFSQFTEPMQGVLREFVAADRPAYAVSSAQPRICDGKPSKNPRYLQDRPDLANPRDRYLAEVGVRLRRGIGPGEPVWFPVDAVLAGRRNNPPDAGAGVRTLCAYNPIHFQELPELFMDFIASLTGKSPSTTGAGSEGALTKGPFNALPPIIDLNNALASYLCTGDAGFSTAAGWVGPHCRVDHDISLLVPEIWSRMRVEERDPAWLIAEGYLEKCEDFARRGGTVLASRLGYRINAEFVRVFFGRVFSDPASVFTPAMLRPEEQDPDLFADGVANIVETQRRVARLYFEDGSVEWACPPLRALLHIMAEGHYEGMTAADPAFRAMFTREAMLESDWYARRLDARVTQEVRHWERAISDLEVFLGREKFESEFGRLDIRGRLGHANRALRWAKSAAYRQSLVGTIGTDPSVVAPE
jgi:hypothetical protein